MMTQFLKGKKEINTKYFNISFTELNLYKRLLGEKNFSIFEKFREEFTEVSEEEKDIKVVTHEEKLEDLLKKKSISKKLKGLITFYAMKEEVNVDEELIESSINKRSMQRIERIINLYENLIELTNSNFEFKSYKSTYLKLRNEGKFNLSYSTFLSYLRELRKLKLVITKRDKTKDKRLLKIEKMIRDKDGKEAAKVLLEYLEYLNDLFSLYIKSKEKEFVKFANPLYNFLLGRQKIMIGPKELIPFIKKLLVMKHLQDKYSIKKLLYKFIKENIQEKEGEINLFIPAYLYQLINVLNEVVREVRKRYEEWGFYGIGFKERNNIIIEGTYFQKSEGYVTHFDYGDMYVVIDRFVLHFHSHSNLYPTPSEPDKQTWKTMRKKLKIFDNVQIKAEEFPFAILGDNGKVLSVSTVSKPPEKINIYVYGLKMHPIIFEIVSKNIARNKKPLLGIYENGEVHLEKCNLGYLRLYGCTGYRERVELLYSS